MTHLIARGRTDVFDDLPSRAFTPERDCGISDE